MPIHVPGFSPKDFGKAAADYAAYRNGFPDSCFARLLKEGIGLPGQRILDLGTGTGVLARRFARQGAVAIGLDITPELIDQAKGLGEREGVQVDYILGKAESAPLDSGRFDVITAGKCWHWFDGPAAARECMRLLKSEGRLVIAHLNHLPVDGNASARTEDLLLEYNPAWPLAGKDGKYEQWREQLEPAGFQDIRSWFYDEDVSFAHEQWRGRIRSCNGALALRDAKRMEAFDRDLAELLKKEFPSEPLRIPHRIFVIQGRKP